jgi:hypothetical protein
VDAAVQDVAPASNQARIPEKTKTGGLIVIFGCEVSPDCHKTTLVVTENPTVGLGFPRFVDYPFFLIIIHSTSRLGRCPVYAIVVGKGPTGPRGALAGITQSSSMARVPAGAKIVLACGLLMVP